MATQTKVVYNNNKKVEARFAEINELFTTFETTRNQTVRFLSKGGVERNIISYVKDSVDRMNEYRVKPGWKEEWQSNVFDPITRDKLIAILSRLAATRMRPELLIKPKSIFTKDDTEMRRMVFSDLLEAANQKNKDDEKLIWEMYTALSEGTVFGFESWMKDLREVEYVNSYDPETGEIKTKKMNMAAWDDVYGQIIPIDELYPETIWTSDWQQIHKVFWVREMTKDGFQAIYGQFPNAGKVKNAGYYRTENNLNWGISSDVNSDNIQVKMFFDELNDKHCIYANGVELYYGPLPWNHKRKPIWRAVGEPIHHQFLYGKSLPDKLMGMQDVDNAVFNAMLDQLFLALNSPIIISGELDLEDGYLEPGRFYEAMPGTDVKRTALGQVDPAVYQTMGLIKRSMEETSVSAQAQGVPTGGRKTKYEVQALQEGALSLAGLFLQMMESAMSDKYYLRMKNILQYYSQPRSGDVSEKFKFIVLENRKLSNGKVGKKMIQIVGSQTDIPAKQDLIKTAEMNSGEPFDILESRVEPIVLTRDYLLGDQFELEIKIVPNSSVKESAADKKNKDIAFYQSTLGNPLFNQEEIARDFARAFDKSESVVAKAPQTNGVPGENSGLPGLPGMKGMPAMQPNMDML